MPADLRVQIGSQWWCLRRRTVEQILGFLRARPDVTRFFRGSWIPDETLFQTLVRHLIPAPEIRSRTPTFLMFTDYGMPVTFYNDHYDMLLGQAFLFARKISPEARELKDRLGQLFASGREDFPISNEGRRLYGFLAGRGRVGRRFAPRFWDAGAGPGRDRQLLIVACKKWHIAKRLVGSIKHHTNLPALDYLFHEEEAALPDLGGIESTLGKRHRHRRTLMRMLFDYFETQRLIICLDIGSVDLMQDFFSDRLTVRLLEIECQFSDVYLAGHARRMGLAAEHGPDAAIAPLLRAVRQDVLGEVDRLRDAGFPNHRRLVEGADPAENAAALASFLSVSPDTALAIANTPVLSFAD